MCVGAVEEHGVSDNRDKKLANQDKRFFIKLSRRKKSHEEIAEAIIAAWGGKPIQKSRKSNR